jgi:hypothetical protein
MSATEVTVVCKSKLDAKIPNIQIKGSNYFARLMLSKPQQGRSRDQGREPLLVAITYEDPVEENSDGVRVGVRDFHVHCGVITAELPSSLYISTMIRT